MKKIILTLILLLGMAVLSCHNPDTPLPDGIRMGMSSEEIAAFTGGELCGNSVITDTAVYHCGINGLIQIIIHENP